MTRKESRLAAIATAPAAADASRWIYAALAAIPALLLIATLLAGRAFGFAFTTEEQGCRDSIAKSGVRLASTIALTFDRCHKSRDKGAIDAAVDCNSAVEADTRSNIQSATLSMNSRVTAACADLDAAALGYDFCPAPCGAAVGPLDDFGAVAACIACLTVDAVENSARFVKGDPAPVLAGETLKCHGAVTGAGSKHFRTVLSERRKCQRNAERGGAIDTSSCTNADPKGKIAKIQDRSGDKIQSRCENAALTELDSCDDGDSQALRGCVLADSNATGEALFQLLYGFANITPTTTTTTTTLGPQDPLCPDTSELTLIGKVTGVCANNADCSVGSCDTSVSRCRTASDLDTGWTGISHNSDISDGALTRAKLRCTGPYDGGSAEPCGICTITGVEPSTNSCRCAGDNRTICDEPFQADDDDCGGGLCSCYLGPPLPLSSGNTPVCVLNRFEEDIRGTANVDTGETEVQIRLRSVVHTGEGGIRPCPYCTGDTVAADGQRDGTCVLGPNDGLACDSDAVNLSFPAVGGDGASLDCFPEPGKNVSGTGLSVRFDQTTGTAAAIDANIPCFFNFFNCHCMLCSGDTSLACDSDDVCAAADAGTCSVYANGANPKTNACDGDFVCVDQGNNDGRCNEGPDDFFCDGVARADGSGYISCRNNADCDSTSCGSVSCGACTVSERRACFLDTIQPTGIADPFYPVTVGAFCIPTTASGGVNSVAGLPGPARLVNQAASTLFCASDPGVEYSPASGGCP